jgi:hypothetical protein
MKRSPIIESAIRLFSNTLSTLLIIPVSSAPAPLHS